MTTNLTESLESRDPNKRWEGVKEAVRLQAVELLPRLCAMMESEQDEFVLCGLLTAAGQLGGAAYADRIGSYLCDPRAIVRETALYALDLTNDPNAVRHVFGALEDSAPTVKQAAHQIVGRFPIETLQKITEEMLLSGVSWQEDHALTALRRLESLPPDFFLLLLSKSRNPLLLSEILKIVATRVECTAETVLKLTDLRSEMPPEVQEGFDAVLDLLNSRISDAERTQIPSIDPSDPDLSRGKIGLLERMGEQVILEKGGAQGLSPAVKVAVERIGRIDGVLAEKESRISEGLKKEIEEGGFWDKTKQSLSKWGNIGKLKLEVSGLSAERNSCLVRIGSEILSLWNKKESLPLALSSLAQKAALLEAKEKAQALEGQKRSEELFGKVTGAAKDFLKKGALLSEAARRSRQFLLQEKLKLQAETLSRRLDLKCENLGSLAYSVIVGSPPAELTRQIKEITALLTHKKLTETEISRYGAAHTATDASQGDIIGKTIQMAGMVKEKAQSLLSVQKLRKDLSEIQRNLHKEHKSLGKVVSQNEEICPDGELRRLAVDVRALRMELTQVEFQLKKLSEEISRDHLAGMLQKHKALQETTEAVTHEILDRHGRDLTIIFTDMKDFTKKTSEGNLVQMMAMLEEHDRILIPVIEQHGGTVIKKIGDALMASFEHPARAVLAGVEIQKALQRHNRQFPEEVKKIQVRIGVNCGKVVVKEGDLYGDAVNLASRVEGLARAEQIFITDSVYQFIDINQIPCIKLPPQKVKGLEKEVQIYEVQY